jgi:translation initiation factor IF-3
VVHQIGKSRSRAARFRLLLFHLHSTGGVGITNELRVNGAIRAKEVRVVAPDGSQIGVKKLNEALWLAEQLDLDLVEVAPNAKPPVCRLMDYGKYKYEQSVKQREARKKQTRTTIKELRMKVRIGDHDFDITKRKAKDFLAEGDKVKVTIRFRGREQERPGFGKDLLDRLAEELGDVSIVEQVPKIEGRSMTMVLAPAKKARATAESSEEI